MQTGIRIERLHFVQFILPYANFNVKGQASVVANEVKNAMPFYGNSKLTRYAKSFYYGN
jgi:hypothetical protein